jgi:hypothetical protein
LPYSEPVNVLNNCVSSYFSTIIELLAVMYSLASGKKASMFDGKNIKGTKC